MAFCPFAVQQIIPESNQQGRITPTTLIYHEAVSSADSLYGYWTTPGVELESHFYIGSTGTIYQFMDTNVRADANVDANAFAISVETWDDSNRNPLLGWNPAMLAAAKRLAAWVCDTHGIKRAAAQTWNGGGIGGHNWFPDPWADGPRQCPGVTRNAQIRNDIIPFVANGGGWGKPAAEENDMQLSDRMKNAFGTQPTIEQVFAAIDLNTVKGREASEKLVGLAEQQLAATKAQTDALNRLAGVVADLNLKGQTQEQFDAAYRQSALTKDLVREGRNYRITDEPVNPDGSQ